MASDNRDIAAERDTVLSNLRMIRERDSRLCELSTLQVNELPAVSLSEGNISRIAKRINQILPSDADTLTVYDRISYLRSLASADRDALLSLLFPDEPASLEIKIAYVPNTYSDAALEAMKPRLKNVSIRTCHSFSELWDEIDSGACNACIIPIENTTNGKLISFYTLIDRFEMKISLTYDIENEDGTQSTRFALLRRRIPLPQDTSDCLFEFSFSSSEDISLCELLRAAELCCLTLYRIDSLPRQYSQSVFAFHPIFGGSAENISAFILFLHNRLSEFTTVGIYNRIS